MIVESADNQTFDHQNHGSVHANQVIWVRGFDFAQLSRVGDYRSICRSAKILSKETLCRTF
jgi:hypothetical protein